MLQWIGGIAVIAIVLLIGIVMGMKHGKTDSSAHLADQETETVSKKKAPAVKKVAKETVSKPSKPVSTKQQVTTEKNTDSTKQEKKSYMDVPYTCTWQGDTYSILLKSDGEYLYNLKVAPTSGNNEAVVHYEKGTYEVNGAGVIRYRSVISKVLAK